MTLHEMPPGKSMPNWAAWLLLVALWALMVAVPVWSRR